MGFPERRNQEDTGDAVSKKAEIKETQTAHSLREADEVQTRRRIEQAERTQMIHD